jgi:DNA-binding FrmR family transcriptional regulator
MPRRPRSQPATYLGPELVEDLQKRLNRIEGHVRGVKRMLAEQEECESILIQAAAVRAALNQVIVKLLEGHMATCVSDCVRAGDVDEALGRLQGALSLVLKNR